MSDSDLVQVNYRVPLELRDAIKARAGELGVEQSVLARKGLEAVLTLDKPLLGDTSSLRGRRRNGPTALHHSEPSGAAGPSERDRGKDPAASRSEDPTVDLSTVLSVRTGMPRSIMARRIREGRVSVNGMVVRDLVIPALGPDDAVTLDGVRC